MKFFTALFLASAAVASAHNTNISEDAATSFLRESKHLEVLELTAKFHSWVDTFNKAYEHEEEMLHRLQVWLHNNAKIEAHNTQEPKPSYTLGHNQYSDMTHEEFKEHFKLGRPFQSSNDELRSVTSEDALEIARSLSEQSKLTLPDYVNWVDAGAVTPIKNQGACGSCWAFSTTGALEGAKFVKTGELVSLSEQNLIDCDKTDLGCSGGLMDDAFKFDETQGGICSEADYPYQASQGACQKCDDVEGTDVTSFVDVPPGDETGLLAAVAMQPVSVAIQADQFPFQFYKSGVLDDDSCGAGGSIDHGVLAVGYGTDLETQKPYWLVKNSWGEEWGDIGGYVKIGRGGANEFGVCSILKLASFPVVE